ncbi:hypothetical protein CAEBREN_25860 [Caenorhabditis brenneri]|uniref:Uncharacterized protein n=1 Tax=Caenorhabditis brenneri TaxID=135651 RepID=G0PNL4_CAEBE|nr:hypothetical protein CAEBREN_25860 [Caenorhabditis brenneri]
MLRIGLVLLVVSCGSVLSLICETCDGSTCYDKDRWVQESCLPSTQYCYRLSSKGRAFRRGCADYPCSQLPGVESGMECRTCTHDRCNNERDSFFHQRGGGVRWRSASTRSETGLLIVILPIITIFLVGLN